MATVSDCYNTLSAIETERRHLIYLLTDTDKLGKIRCGLDFDPIIDTYRLYLIRRITDLERFEEAAKENKNNCMAEITQTNCIISGECFVRGGGGAGCVHSNADANSWRYRMNFI